MFGKKSDPSDPLIGEKNSAKAMQLLMERNTEITVVNVGEQEHRQIVMDVGTGDVWVKYKTEDAQGKSIGSQSGLN